MIIIGIIAILVGIALVWAIEYSEPEAGALGMIGGILIVFGIGSVGVSLDNKPTALDIYRNKTTLEVTYKDSIPVDTVVVFKDKYARN